MMKLKKLAAIILAVMMMAAVATAWASEAAEIGDDGTVSDGDKTNGFDALSNTVSFPKQIIVYNDDDAATVYGPSITYTYTISAATVAERNADGVTVTDGDGDVGTVYSGVAAAITTANKTTTAVFSNDTVTGTLTDGVAVSKDVKFTFDPTKFGHAGIFRYLITESVGSNARETAGVESVPTYAATRYLDVYVHNNSSGALEIYGYVLFEPDATEGADENITTTRTKSSGYVDTNSSDGISNIEDVDVFYTDNLTISKAITGLGDKTHEFPFYVTLTQGTSDVNPENVQVTVDGTKKALSTAISDGITARGMKDGDTMTIVGIPRKAVITAGVYEKNDTWDDYKLSTETNGTEGLDAVVIGHNKYSGGDTDCAQGASTQSVLIGTTQNTGEETIDFTNDLTEISPTGYVARFAPYALILIGGIALLIIAKKHKKHTEEE